MTPTTSARHEALRLIKDEHRSLAAVIHALQFLIRRAQKGEAPRLELMAAILHYLTQFPERLHHPAEERWIIEPLRASSHEAQEQLDRLEADHRDGHAREARLLAAMSGLTAKRTGALAEFEAVVDAYAQFYWDHMVREETVLLPLAERVLTEDQWQAAQKGFAAHRDPMYGGDTAHDFEALFERIVRQTPAPEGLADA